MQIKVTLNEGFIADVEYEVSCDEVCDLRIKCPVTGMDLTDLIAYSSAAWDQAWNAAERHMLSMPNPQVMRDMRSMTYDTPFAR